MRHSDDNDRRMPEYVRTHIYDTDQTDYAEPVGRGVWNGVIITILLLGLGIGMMSILANEDTTRVEQPRYERAFR